MSSPSRAAPLVETVALADERDVPAHARRLVQRTVARVALDHLADDASTVVTELVSNALLHGAFPAQLRVLADPAGTVRLEVSDASPTSPVRPRHDDDAMTGRGLALVDALTYRWGVQPLARGKIVWAELREPTLAGGSPDDADDVDASWPTLQSAGAQDAVDGPTHTVHLGEVPTDLLLAAKAHVDNLVREFSLVAAGARAGMTASVPGHVAELIDAVVHRFAAAREAIKRQALAAATAGDRHVRLQLTLPVSAAEAGEEYLRALDQADSYCRAARLLTLESPPQHRVFRRWYVEELIAQLRRAAAGQPAMPAETFEQRLLREIDAIAAAERAAERSGRLHALSSALSSALTPEAVTAAVLGQGVAALRASGGAILLTSSTSTLTLPGAVGYGEQVIARLRAESADAELPAALALRTGQPVWLESREERDHRFPALAGLEPSTISMCAVPLAVADRCLGALRFSFAEARLFDEQEREFVLAMAALTAQALDRAQLYAQRIDISERLQRSLLPPRLPAIPGVRIEAAYHPLGDGVDVGGDFYDVWACGDARWAFAIGDASGTGPEAAAMTALVRHTLRALTLHGAGMDAALHQLDRALRDAHTSGDDDRFCTVLLGLVTVTDDAALVSVASGGHPGPVVVRGDGRVEEVELTGSLLGVLSNATTDRRDIELRRGDEMVLYTDGVTDARDDGAFFDVDGVLSTARTVRGHDQSLVDALTAAVRSHGGGCMRDDVAVLSLRFVGGGR